MLNMLFSQSKFEHRLCCTRLSSRQCPLAFLGHLPVSKFTRSAQFSPNFLRKESCLLRMLSHIIPALGMLKQEGHSWRPAWLYRKIHCSRGWCREKARKCSGNIRAADMLAFPWASLSLCCVASITQLHLLIRLPISQPLP